MSTNQSITKNDTSRIRGNHAFAFIIAILMSLYAFPHAAFAEEGTTGNIIDQSKKGSLTIYTVGTDSVSGFDGVGYSYVKVADSAVADYLDGSKGLAFTNINTDLLAAIGSPISDTSTVSGYKFSTLKTAFDLVPPNTISTLTMPYTPMPSTSGGTDTVASSTHATGLDVGLYLVKQHSGPLSETTGHYTNPFLVSIPSGLSTAWDYDVEVHAKHLSGNETLTKTSNLSNTSVGEAVTHTVSATASATTEASRYTSFNINDILPTGLTLPVANQIQISASTLILIPITDYTIALNNSLPATNNILFTLTPAGLAKLNGVTKTETITMTYSATLNSSAVVGDPGNVDTATLNYANKDIVGAPKKATAEVSTYGFTAKKIDATSKSPLSAAKFKLYANENDAITGTSPLSFYSALNGTQLSGASTSVVASSTTGLASFFGLASGDYYLVETEAPNSYVPLGKPVKVTVNNATSSLVPQITISNVKQVDAGGEASLPITGESGIALIIIGGLILITVSTIAFSVYTRKKNTTKK